VTNEAEGRPRHSLTAGAILVTAASGVFVLSGYIVNVWLGRLLGPADYGRFGIVIGVVTILNVIQNTSVPQAVARTVAHTPQAAATALRRGAELQLIISVLMAAAVVLAAPLIGHVLGDAALTDVVRLAGLSLAPYGLFALFLAFHNGTRNYVRQAVSSIVYSVTKGVAAVGLAHAFQLAGAVGGYALAAMMGCAASWPSIRAARVSLPYRQLIGLAVPIAAYAIASVALMSVDIFFVKAGVADPRAAGFYAAGQSISRIPFYLMSGLAAVILPGVAAAMQRGHDAATRTAAEAIRWSVVAVVPVVAVMTPTSDALIELLFSSEYRPGGTTLAVLLPAIGALAISSILAGLLAGIGRPWPAAVMALAGVVVTLGACGVLVPMAGPEGAALGTLTGSVVALLGMATILWRSMPGVAPLATISRVILVAVPAGLIARFVDPAGIDLVALYAALGAATIGVLGMAGDIPLPALRGAREQ
jgi:O-antigen/teichoic acid export membrane protein